MCNVWPLPSVFEYIFNENWSRKAYIQLSHMKMDWGMLNGFYILTYVNTKSTNKYLTINVFSVDYDHFFSWSRSEHDHSFKKWSRSDHNHFFKNWSRSDHDH